MSLSPEDDAMWGGVLASTAYLRLLEHLQEGSGKEGELGQSAIARALCAPGASTFLTSLTPRDLNPHLFPSLLSYQTKHHLTGSLTETEMKDTVQAILLFVAETVWARLFPHEQPLQLKED